MMRRKLMIVTFLVKLIAICTTCVERIAITNFVNNYA